MAVVDVAADRPRVRSVVVPALRDLGVQRGTDATLTLTGADTTAALAQLDSFIEHWKTDGTNALDPRRRRGLVEAVRREDQGRRSRHAADLRHDFGARRCARRAEGARVAEPVRRHHHRRGPDGPRAHEDAALLVLPRHLGAGGRREGAVTERGGQAAERQAGQHLQRGRGRRARPRRSSRRSPSASVRTSTTPTG